jgi:hypothetical protein
MEERASIPPGLPRPRPTLSYWQDPPSAIACLRTTDHLPEHVDVVIIGSGITGASIAYNLLAQQPELSIVLLEAREAASGASGRNGRLGGARAVKDNCFSLSCTPTMWYLVFLIRYCTCRRSFQRGILPELLAQCQHSWRGRRCQNCAL